MDSHLPPKVLIVDDQPGNLDALEVLLAPCDCVLVRASSGDEALLRLLRDDFAAIVLDIRMPDINGFELASLIKQRKRSQLIPILLLTAHLLEDDDVLRGYGAGAVDYLTKPVNAEILRSKIGVFIDLFRKTHELAALNTRLEEEVVERVNAQRALEEANQDLERRVCERTATLAQAHQDVREDEERWRMAMEVANVAAWELHVASDRKTWSTDPEVLFGFPAGALGPELRLKRAVHPADRALLDERIVAALACGNYDAEFRVVRPDGRVLWVTERGSVVPDAEGKPERILGISRDVTAEHEVAEERERLLKSARDAGDEAERQSRLKDEFLATLSHELRTPMNVILGWLDILLSGKPIRDLQSTLALIQHNARLQAKLIDDLLDMNRLMAGDVRLEITSVDVGATLQATTRALQPSVDAKNIDLRVRLQSTPVEVQADGRLIQQVLWNLLHNAIKFTPDGGRVDASVERLHDEVRIAVQDTGRGISPSFLPFVFERFRQEDPSTTRESFGLGLGLSIAKRLVEVHGGSIAAHSGGLGQGATFSIKLPLVSPWPGTLVANRPTPRLLDRPSPA